MLVIVLLSYIVSCFDDCCCGQKESYHTHLAVLYLDSVLSMRKSANPNADQLDQARYAQFCLFVYVIFRVFVLCFSVEMGKC